MAMRESAEAFGEDGTVLRGMLHWPAAGPPALGMVMCGPFGERAQERCPGDDPCGSSSLCREGFAVLRFDYRGTGESDGCIERTDRGQWAEDIRSAQCHLVARTGAAKVGLLGIRFGAALAALAGKDEASLPFFVAWSPLWNGHSYLEESLRHLAATRLAVHGTRGGNGRVWNEPSDSLDMGGFCLSPKSLAAIESIEVSCGDRADVVVVVDVSRRAAASEQHEAICRRLATPRGLWRTVNTPGRPFWVTASRYDPQPLVDYTIETLAECGVAAGSAVESEDE